MNPAGRAVDHRSSRIHSRGTNRPSQDHTNKDCTRGSTTKDPIRTPRKARSRNPTPSLPSSNRLNQQNRLENRPQRRVRHGATHQRNRPKQEHVRNRRCQTNATAHRRSQAEYSKRDLPTIRTLVPLQSPHYAHSCRALRRKSHPRGHTPPSQWIARRQSILRHAKCRLLHHETHRLRHHHARHRRAARTQGKARRQRTGMQRKV